MARRFPEFPAHLQATGCLAGWRSDGGSFAALRESSVINILPAERPGWWKGVVVSKSSLARHYEPPAERYYYFFLFRESGAHLLLLSSHSELIPRLLQHHKLLQSTFSPAVNVNGLVRLLRDSPGQYLLGAVYGRVRGFGDSLRSISLFGNDIAATPLFHELSPNIQASRANLRCGDTEILSIGSRGEITFKYSKATKPTHFDSLKAVEDALRFVTEQGFVDWQRPRAIIL